MFFVPKERLVTLIDGKEVPRAGGPGEPIPISPHSDITQVRQEGPLGRCRRHAPTLSGWPAVFDVDWCGDHKLDETKL
jgi:hypothetical protein